MRDPTDAGLDPADLQLGEALEHAGEDHVGDVAGRHREHVAHAADRLGARGLARACRRAGCRAAAAALRAGAALRAADDVDVDRDRACPRRPRRPRTGRRRARGRRCPPASSRSARPWRRAPWPCAARRPRCRCRATGSAPCRSSRFGSGAQNSSNRKLLYASTPASTKSSSSSPRKWLIVRCGGNRISASTPSMSMSVEPRRAVVATGARLVVGDAVPAELVERHARRRRRARSGRGRRRPR